jgi:OOP family OmpA-OmpF porin
MRLKTTGKVVVLIVVVGVAFGAYRMFGDKLLPSAQTKESLVPDKVNLPSGNGQGVSSGTHYDLPSSDLAPGNGPEVRMLVWAWNAQMGLMFANGGPQTTKGSLMASAGVNLHMSRQDDSGKMQEGLVAFAQDLKNGNSNPSKGTMFVNIMGDGAAQFLKGANDVLKKLGPEYQAKIVAVIGYSRGEDKFMGPGAWKDNPSACKGGVVAGVLRDGDWNIAEKWLGDNSLPTNPDEKTYDPDALNWVAANDYLDAAEKYIAGYTETRPVVRHGKKTGETKTIKVNACVTWTPGDVNVAKKKGGLVTIAGTKEYTTQMPCVIIGIDKWMKDNRSTVENLIKAALQGGDAVRSSDANLQKAGEVSQQVYQEKDSDANYWVKYYKGAREADATGIDLDLGGSSVNNLADTMFDFGLVSGSANLVEATYTAFGNVDKEQYPNLIPDYPPASVIIDTSYIKDLAASNAPSPTLIKEAKPQRVDTTTKLAVVSRKNISIPFETGSAQFSPSAKGMLEKLRRDLLVASGLSVEIHGHTDNQGDPKANMDLSERRAFAVKDWLQKQFPANFPEGRVRIFSHGQEQPLAPNSSADGRAKNRRVEVVLGKAE